MENSRVDDFIEQRPHFIGKNEFPFVGVIKSWEKVRGKYGTDVRIGIENDAGELRHFDLWGGNLNFMVNTKGQKLDDWVGVKVHINRTPDLKRVLSLVLN